MLGLDRRTLHVAWSLLLFAAVVATIYAIRRTLMVFALALFFAHLLSPVVEFVQRRVSKRVPRVAVLSMVYVVLVGALAAVVVLVGSRIAEDATVLASKLPQALQQEDPLSHVPLPSWMAPLRPRLTDMIHRRVDELDQNVLPLLSQASLHILTGIESLFLLILIPILSFFFLKNGAEIREAIVEGVDSRQRSLVDNVLSDLHLLLAKYMRALVFLAIATFLFYLSFLSIMRVPYGILLAGFAAMLEVIPVVGPLAAAIVIFLVALFAGYPHLLWILLFLVVYRIFLDYVLSPHLMSAGVQIHPMLVLFGVLAGEQIYGIPGMFFSVPVMAALRLIFIRLRRRHRAS